MPYIYFVIRFSHLINPSDIVDIPDIRHRTGLLYSIKDLPSVYWFRLCNFILRNIIVKMSSCEGANNSSISVMNLCSYGHQLYIVR